MKKNSCTPVTPKKYSCCGLTKIHTRTLITKKIRAAQKFPSPHNFSNGSSRSHQHFSPSQKLIAFEMGASQINIGSSAAKKVPRATQAIGKHINTRTTGTSFINQLNFS